MVPAPGIMNVPGMIIQYAARQCSSIGSHGSKHNVAIPHKIKVPEPHGPCLIHHMSLSHHNFEMS